MKRGPKPQTAVTKAKRGTLRADRDGDAPVQLIMAVDPPIMPDYLAPAAQEIWMEEIGRVMAGGVIELDSTLFARYCSTEALVRAAFLTGEAPPAAFLTYLDRAAEKLNIAGPRCRYDASKTQSKTDNPFTRNGRKV